MCPRGTPEFNALFFRPINKQQLTEMAGNGNLIRAAAREGRHAKLEHILATNSEGVDECDKNGMSALHAVAYYGHLAGLCYGLGSSTNQSFTTRFRTLDEKAKEEADDLAKQTSDPKGAKSEYARRLLSKQKAELERVISLEGTCLWPRSPQITTSWDMQTGCFKALVDMCSNNDEFIAVYLALLILCYCSSLLLFSPAGWVLMTCVSPSRAAPQQNRQQASTKSPRQRRAHTQSVHWP